MGRKGKGGGGQQTQHYGGRGHAGGPRGGGMFTAEDRMTMDAMNAKRKKKEEDERDAKIERRVAKNFERKYGKGRGRQD